MGAAIPTRAPQTGDLGEWASWYASLGFKVLPLAGKAPKIKKVDGGNGVHDATGDRSQITKWWSRWPTANIGLACGDGQVVFDIDHRHGGEVPFDTILADNHILRSPFGLSGSGDGFHLYMYDPTGRVRSREYGDGIDVLAAGKYAVAPPSVHPDSGRRYEWMPGCPLVARQDLPEMPLSLVNVLDPPRPARKPRAKHAPANGATPYGKTALDGLLDELQSAPQGQRHPTLFRVAARAADLAHAGHLEAGAAYDAIAAVGVDIYAGEGRELEVERTVAAAFSKASAGGAA